MRQHPWWLSASLLLAGSVGSQTLFTDATGRLGLEFEGRSARNVIFADYDNDGFQDIFIAENSVTDRQIGLFHNTGDGRSVNQTDLIPGDLHSVDGQGGSVFADYDNDGDQDLYLSASPHNMLLRNDGGRFSKVSVTTTDTLVTDQAIWLDYDRDGLLDLYVSNEFVSENRPPRGNRLFHNDGNGSFSDQTAAAGLDVPLGTDDGGSTGGMAAGDFNNDGWPDLYLGVNRQPNRLFLNDGQGRFRDATTSEIGDEGEAFSIAVGDIDNDGDLDILQPAGASDDEGFRSKMLLNLGGGEFLDVLEAAGLDTLNNSNVGGTLFADFDNDGDLDLVVGTSNRTNLLLLNDGSGFFSEATSISGIKDRGAYIAVGDYDEDGFLDLLYASFTRELTALYRNNGNSNRWLRVELVGIESNRDGIGSRLIATSGDLVQMREILGGVGRQQDEKVAHFGLAGRTLVDRLEIRWPSGQIDVLQSIPADRKIRVFEGRAGYQVARPTIWENAPPEVVVENTTTPFAIRIRPRLFEPNAEVTRVSADLSAFGGESAVELEAAGDGTYRLQTTLVVSDSRGPRQVSVAVEQATFLGPRLARLAWSITVAPAVDLPVFEEKSEQSWQVSSRWLKNLSVDPAWDYTPAWSPDGTKILFSSFRGGMDIYQVMRDGSDLHRLTSASLWDWFPSFSPDGTKVVFSTNRDGNGELYVMDADGSNEVRLTDHQEDDGAGTFSPDGTRIVFDSDRDGNREVYVIDADGSNPVRLTNNPANDGHATWSPDGTKILFFSNRDGNNEIYVMNADGSNPVNLTQHAADDSDPDFSPDGSRIAFSSNRDGDNDIYVMNADGSNPVNLTSYPMFDLIPDWSPDGRHLVFARGPGRPDIYILEVEPSDRLVVQADQQRVVNHGRSAVQVSARDGEWQVLYEPEAPVDPAGYEAIRFAIHPGDTEAREGAFFELALDESAKPGPPYTRNNSPSSKIDLLQVARPEARIDLTIRDWQVVQVPLDLLPGVQGSIDAINFFGNLHGTFYLDDVRLVTAASAPRATAVEEGATALPGAFALDQNYPNPFNSGTAIGFDLPQSDHVEMAVFNLAGQKVMNLVEGPRDAGSYTLRWDGRDGRGRSLASGVYLYRLQVGKLVETRKLLLLR